MSYVAFYNYGMRGDKCVPITPAKTSNKKFLQPGECIYNKPYKTFLQPASTFPTGNFSKNIYIPEQAKAYYIPFGPQNDYYKEDIEDEGRYKCCGGVKRGKNLR